MFERLDGRGSEETRDHRFAAPLFPEINARAGEERGEFSQEQYEDREAATGSWELETPFLGTETGGLGAAAEAPTPEIEALAETMVDLKDAAFRESLEQLAEEALDVHAEQLTGEYGDQEDRDANAQRLLEDHFQPLTARAHAMLDGFFERLEGYEAEALTDTAIARVASEVMPSGASFSPASEQFLGGLLDKAKKLASSAVKLAKRGVQGAVKLAGKGIAAVGKLAFGPLLDGLKKLAAFLLRHVVRFALDKIPPNLRPLAQKLSDRLFQALGQSHEGETADHEQSGTVLAAPDAACLEAEFDLELAQLLLTPDETEADHQVASYGEAESGPHPLAELDQARTQLAEALQRLEPGQSAEPAMEQFLPAAWPVVKTAITVLGRPKVVGYIVRFLGRLIQPILGAEGAGQLAPALADAGLRIFGLETGELDPRGVTAEALTATVEETIQSLSELPPYVFENEALLETAVREAFEDAAATYFPPALIKPELRETADQHGLWARMPLHSPRKRYAKYSESPEVTISPRVAAAVRTFGGATLKDYLRDRMNIADGRTVKTNIRLYQATPGTTAAQIARAEGFMPQDLHPLTQEAAGALLGRNAGLASRGAPTHGLHSRSRLHKRQRLYYIEPPGGRHHRHRRHRHHARLARSELLINLHKGEIRVWLYLSEALCQQVSAELTKTRGVSTALRLIMPLVRRATEMLRSSLLEQHLPPELRVIGDAPNLDSRVPAWLVAGGKHLAAKIEEWVSQDLAGYLQNNAEEFRRVSASEHDGLTLRVTITRIPGIETLRVAAKGQLQPLQGTGWLNGGKPAVVVDAHKGHALK